MPSFFAIHWYSLIRLGDLRARKIQDHYGVMESGRLRTEYKGMDHDREMTPWV
jgi:hypothetical protein